MFFNYVRHMPREIVYGLAFVQRFAIQLYARVRHSGVSLYGLCQPWMSATGRALLL